MRRSLIWPEATSPNSKATADASVVNDACVFVRCRNLRFRFSKAFVVRIDFHIGWREFVEGEQLFAGLLEASNNGRGERVPLGHELSIGVPRCHP